MGVPAFFRWLQMRYPKTVAEAFSEDMLEILYTQFKAEKGDPNEINLQGDDEAKEHAKKFNPSIDNLYLDMNGIIHPCTHPEGKPAPTTDIEMFNNIFEYVDKVMSIVKPKRILYLAIDGVAPRAKMNQQRSRRFRGALEAEQKEETEKLLRGEFQKRGVKFSDTAVGEASFDKNVITPGTEFMWRLSKSLQHYIYERTHNHELWQGVKVIFSDASNPGEGEHKILDFIRSQRLQVGYDPNTSHCIFGADADLIMLGLSTHEPHFYVLREAFISDFDKKCNKCGEQGHTTPFCPEIIVHQRVTAAYGITFQWIKLSVVREYLYLEFKDMRLPFAFDIERLIDDFVLMCFFVGNDFLPHMPGLDIREGAIDAIMAIYKQQLPALGDYLTANGRIDFNRVDLIFNDLAKIEEELIRSKRAFEDRMKAQEGAPQKRMRTGINRESVVTAATNEEDSEKSPNVTAEEEKQRVFKEIEDLQAEVTEEELNKRAAQRMKDIAARVLKEKEKKIADNYVDKVQLGVDGWKLRYYTEKFHVSQGDVKEFIGLIKKAYLEGLQWVYSYYYNGCVSWTWFYPFHYAPFPSDLVGATIEIKFEMGEPASPYEQLMGVFPKQSAHAIPVCYRSLLSDPNSEIIDFYPTNFHIDINGARFAWMGVALLPFIDRHRLVAAMKKADRGGEALSEHEKELNKPGQVYVFFHSKDSRSGLVQALTQVKGKDIELKACFERSDAISGTVRATKVHVASFGQKLAKPYVKLELPEIAESQVYSLPFRQTSYKLHVTRLLENAILPAREVEDFELATINRRAFNGERAIKMLERILGFEANVSNIQRGGYYQNNRASTYEGASYSQPYRPRPHQHQGHYQGPPRGGYHQQDYYNQIQQQYRPARPYGPTDYNLRPQQQPSLLELVDQAVGLGKRTQRDGQQQPPRPPPQQQQNRFHGYQ